MLMHPVYLLHWRGPEASFNRATAWEFAGTSITICVIEPDGIDT